MEDGVIRNHGDRSLEALKAEGPVLLSEGYFSFDDVKAGDVRAGCIQSKSLFDGFGGFVEEFESEARFGEVEVGIGLPSRFFF